MTDESADSSTAPDVLSLFVLNVGQGDAIAIRFPDDKWGIVDSNIPPEWMKKHPPILEFLLNHGVDQLAFVCMTHPHADHYRGMLKVLEYFRGRVSEFWATLDSGLVKDYLDFLKDTVTVLPRRSAFEELARISRHVFIEERRNIEFQCLGFRQALQDFGGVHVFAIAPPGKARGKFIAQFSHEKRWNENLISAALVLEYGDARILLGGDVEKEVWQDVDRRRENYFELQSDVIKVSHHGAQSSYHTQTWKKCVFPRKTLALISTGGKTGHPHPAVLEGIRDSRAYPYCTTLNSHCAKTSKVDLSDFANLPREAQIHLLMTSKHTKQPGVPCQGSIEVTVDQSGRIVIKPERNRHCHYRIFRQSVTCSGYPQ